MPRRLRFVPSQQLVAVTCRTLRREFRLRPNPKSNAIIAGAIARALEIHQVKLHAVTVMSNHMHLLLTPKDARALASFMHAVNRKIAYELNRLQRCTGSFWDGRYHSVLVTDEEAAQVAQLKYILSQGCKEGLVASPFDWPGVQSSCALTRGKTLEGIWFDRTAFHRVRRQEPTAGAADFTTAHRIQLDPLPIWAHLDEPTRRSRVLELIQDIEEETKLMHQRQGTKPAGRSKARTSRPFHRPKEMELDSTPLPLVHAVSRERRDKVGEVYKEFVLAYRMAAEKLKSGSNKTRIEFPIGSFPPPLPFVSSA